MATLGTLELGVNADLRTHDGTTLATWEGRIDVPLTAEVVGATERSADVALRIGGRRPGKASGALGTAAAVLRMGHNVAWFGPRVTDGGVIDALVDLLGSDAEKSAKTNGAQYVTSRADGRLDIYSPATVNRIRGRRIQLAVLHDWQLIRNDGFMDVLLPAFATSEPPRIAVEA